jgi:hypothetical protein
VVLAIAFAALAGLDARACSPPPGYRIVEAPAAGIETRARIPPQPMLRVQSLTRGFDDGMGTSCSDTGVLTLVVEDAAENGGTAYFFDVTDGRAPADLLPRRLITPVELETGEVGFVFRWLDLPPGATSLEPIVATIEARRISQFGLASAPATVRIAHAGGNLPPKAYTRTIAVLRTVTQIAIALLVPLFVFAYLRQRRRLRKVLREVRGALGPRDDADGKR